ncbi:hypothetical protein G7Y79_00034g069780 [Physcia stellaris]|nr:hypothetical protein G7Y79_00034g069780 [Physcia stellaris]
MSTKQPIPSPKGALTQPNRTSQQHNNPTARLDIYCDLCSASIGPNTTGCEKAAHMYLKHRIRIPFTPDQENHSLHEKMGFDTTHLAAEAVNRHGNGKRPTKGRFGPSPSPSSSSPSNRQHVQHQYNTKPPNHYAILGVRRLAPHAAIVKAAKAKRVECHPDRVKRGQELCPEMERAVDEWAKKVGCAAEVLGDRGLRRRYEEEIVEWEVRTGGGGRVVVMICLFYEFWFFPGGGWDFLLVAMYLYQRGRRYGCGSNALQKLNL